MPKWKNVNVLQDQIEDIEKIIKNPFINEKYRILNVPEFVKIAINEKLNNLKDEIKHFESEKKK